MDTCDKVSSLAENLCSTPVQALVPDEWQTFRCLFVPYTVFLLIT